jgi:hypothetical protein
MALQKLDNISDKWLMIPGNVSRPFTVKFAENWLQYYCL